MLNPNEPVYEILLTGGLTLRTVTTLAALERIAALNGVVHEPAVGEMTRKIFAQHPVVSGRDLAYIENEQREVIEIPWTLRFRPVER